MSSAHARLVTAAHVVLITALDNSMMQENESLNTYH